MSTKAIAEQPQRKHSEAQNSSITTESSFITGKPHRAPSGFYTAAGLPGAVDEPAEACKPKQEQPPPQSELLMKTDVSPIPILSAPVPGPQPILGIPILGPVLLATPILVERSPKDILRSLSSIYVQQKIQPFELLTGCEIENVYQVYRRSVVTDHESKRRERIDDKILFKCKEKSGWCARNCLGAACRPFSMSISCRYTMSNGRKRMEPFLKLERPCACTCCCFARPYIKVYLVKGKEKTLLGRVVEPWAACDVVIDVFKAKEEHPIYKIITGYFQCGLIFQCPCKGCNEVTFEIRDPRTKAKVGRVKKVRP